MNKEIKYWKWKNTIIDFKTLSDEKDKYCDYLTKKQLVFHYLGIPDEEVHEWYNGGYSSEYNSALTYAYELDLIEDYVDYENKIYELQEKLDKINEYCQSCIDEYNNKLNENEEHIYYYPAYVDDIQKIIKGGNNE